MRRGGNLFLNKKALSDIVSTLLILLLVFVAVAILWLVVRNVIQQGTEQVSLGKFTLDLKIERVSVNENINQVNIKVKRNTGEGEFVGLKFIVDDEDDSEIFNYNGTMDIYQEMTFSFNLSNVNVSNIKQIRVAPIFRLSSGKEVVGDVKDTYNVQTIVSGVVCADTCTSLNYTCGTQTICNALQNCGSCNQTGFVCSGGSCVLGATCNDTCTSLNYTCGTQTICGASTNCGTCATGQTCSSGTCVASCTDTCTSLGYTCGTQTICGASTNCGTCATGQTCSLGNCISNSTCTDTCASLGHQCGTQTICGASTNCGTCATGQTCSAGDCIASGNACNVLGSDCFIENGIGQTTCSGGTWSSCQVVRCDPGFVQSGGACIPVTFTGTTHVVDSSNVNSILASSSCGDRVVFSDGSYSNLQITISGKQCTQNNPLVFASQTIGGVTFGGSMYLNVVGSSYVIVDGFSFVNATRSSHLVYLEEANNIVLSNNEFIRSGSTNRLSGVIHLETNAHHNIIKNNYFEDLPSVGFQIRSWAGEGADNQYNIFKYNYFKGSNSNPAIQKYFVELIQLGNGMYDDGHASPSMGDWPWYTVVEHNLFEDINYVGEVVSDKTSNNIHRYNTYRNVCDSLTLRHGTNKTVQSNYFLASRGLRVYDRDHKIVNNYFAQENICGSSWTGLIVYDGEVERPDMSDAGTHYPADNVIVAHNTIINQNNYLRFAPTASWPIDLENASIYGNLIVNDKEQAISGTERLASFVADDNIVYSTGTGVAGYSGSGVTVLDPQVTFDGTVYRISSSSPAVDASSYPIGLDLEGKVRNSPDIGALEYGTSTVYPPLTSSNVGPGIFDRVI